jgi:hypothetical protein
MDLLQTEWLYPLLVVVSGTVGGIITWFIRSRLEESRELERRLRDERSKVYIAILGPYIELFASISGGDQREDRMDEITKKVLSVEYRKTIFELGLLGSDEVVYAYNDLMQYFFKLGTTEKQDMYETIRLWGTLRLEIRKSLGNKRTKLNAFDMLRGEIKDIDKLMG